MQKFDYSDIAATHKIMKRDVGIAYIVMRKNHYNVMNFKTSTLCEIELLYDRYNSVNERHYVLHDIEKIAEK